MTDQPPTNHQHEVPMRWADLDVLNHVNNVTYLEYAAEAQDRLADQGLAPAEAPTDITVKFLAPVLLSQTPITVLFTYDGTTLSQEIRSQTDGALLNATVASSWDTTTAMTVPDGAKGPVMMQLRRGDIAHDGTVSIAKTFELLQETRVLLLSQQLRELRAGSFVVGTVAAHRRRPLGWQREPLEAYGWISRVGRGSVTVETVLSDHDGIAVSASSTLVGFDLENQVSRPFEEEERQMLEAAVLA